MTHRAKTCSQPQPLESRFWQKVDKNGPIPAYRPDLGPCWLWTAYCDHDGYGRFYVDGRCQRAHRISWELKNGPLPTNLEPDHLCRVRNCVNPSHIEAVTKAENIRRGISPSAQHAKKTHCPQGHAYSGANLYVTTGGLRVCRECVRAAGRRYRARRRAA